MSKSLEVLKILSVHHQKTLPGLAKTLPTSHVSNTKDYILKQNEVLSAIIAYLILKEQEIPAQAAQVRSQGIITPDVAATLAAQGRTVAPSSPHQTKTVIVGTTSQDDGGISNGGLVEPETDPEPSHQIQINTRRDGSVVVVPPLNSKAPKKVFPPGMPVDATYIQKIDNPDVE